MGSTTLFAGTPKRNRGAQARLAPNFVEKLKILSLSGFSWLGTLIQAVGNMLWETFLHLPEVQLNFLKFGFWVWRRVEAFDIRSTAFPCLWRPKF